MGKIKGLRDDGSIETKALQSDEDIYKMIDYLANFLQNSNNCILERDGDRVTWISDSKPPVVINISKLKGSDRANFLNSTGIIREYNRFRKNTSKNQYFDVGSEVDIGGIPGYGFPPGQKGIIKSYRFYPGDNVLYAEILTPRGVLPIPFDILNGYSSK